MECCGRAVVESDRDTCPTCQTKGRAVKELTVKSLLTESALRRFAPGVYRFCPRGDCAVVYFNDSALVFSTSDLRVPVWQKEPPGDRMICYCFGETEVGMRAEILHAGTTKAVHRVREHIEAGRCACEVRNPRGVCCLGDLIEAMERMASHV